MVTAGRLTRLERSAPPGFLKRFDAIVTGEDTGEGKPSPEPYLCGARRLGVRPQACIVVENAPLGIEAAKRAGAYCIALRTTLDEQALAGADEVVASFEALVRCDLIRRLLA
jgi:beta-phosphoglucomutase